MVHAIASFKDGLLDQPARGCVFAQFLGQVTGQNVIHPLFDHMSFRKILLDVHAVVHLAYCVNMRMIHPSVLRQLAKKHWLHWMKEQRLLYRLALGQPNQEDLIEILSNKVGMDPKSIRDAVINLSPWFREHSG